MDTFENILPVLILVIYIISIFWKKKNQNRPEMKPGEKTGEESSKAQRWLENLMEQVVGEIEQTKPAPPPDPTTVIWEKNKSPEKPPPVPETRAQRDRKAMKARQEKAAPPSGRPKPADPVKRKQKERPCPGYSRKMLRDRIIWAEILGPPVALREKDNHY